MHFINGTIEAFSSINVICYGLNSIEPTIVKHNTDLHDDLYKDFKPDPLIYKHIEFS